jgi:hypothetical protein
MARTQAVRRVHALGLHAVLRAAPDRLPGSVTALAEAVRYLLRDENIAVRQAAVGCGVGFALAAPAEAAAVMPALADRMIDDVDVRIAAMDAVKEMAKLNPSVPFFVSCSVFV